MQSPTPRRRGPRRARSRQARGAGGSASAETAQRSAREERGTMTHRPSGHTPRYEAELAYLEVALAREGLDTALCIADALSAKRLQSSSSARAGASIGNPRADDDLTSRSRLSHGEA